MRTPFPINLDQAQTWIEKSIFINDISLIYQISDDPERILSTDYRIGGISKKKNIGKIIEISAIYRFETDKSAKKSSVKPQAE